MNDKYLNRLTFYREKNKDWTVKNTDSKPDWRKYLNILLDSLKGNSNIFFLNKITCVENELFQQGAGNFTLPNAATDNGKVKTDKVASLILEHYGNLSLKPVKSTPDGNCYFNSLSNALCGNESLAQEIRLRTALQMVKYRNNFIQMRNLNKVCPSYDQSVVDCLTLGGYSNAYTLAASASAINVIIKSLYPPLNGLVDEAFRILSCDFYPLNHNTLLESTLKSIHIMWSNTSFHSAKLNEHWLPNHFVALLPLPFMDVKQIDSDNESEMETFSNDFRSNACGDKIEEYLMSCSDDDTENASAANFSSNDANTNQKHTTDIHTHFPLKCEQFLPFQEVFQIIENAKDEQVLKLIPLGLKENVGFIINNESNVTRREGGKHRLYEDDCGTWLSSAASSPICFYIKIENAIVNVFRKKNLFCKPININGKRNYEVLNPQPHENNVLTVYRHYSKHKVDASFKRRVTCISNPMSLTFEKKCYIEYVGKYPAKIPHGNCNEFGRDYIRINSKCINDIKSHVKLQKPCSVYKRMLEDDNICNQPRSKQQIYDIKYKDKLINSKACYSLNFADEIVALENMLSTHPFVQAVIHTKSKIPSVILYCDEQLQQFKSQCLKTKEPEIFGIDKTFNLGDFFVTAIAYKHRQYIRRSTQEVPIILGPIFLHGDSDYKTYYDFFSHLRLQFDNSVKPVIGSDNELAMRKAMEKVFPEAT